MIKVLRRLLACTGAAAAVEAAIVAPLLFIFALGATDLGTAMFAKMTVNAAAQAGGAYAVKHADVTSTPTCSTLTPGCLTGIQTAITDASGGLTINASPAPTITTCADLSPQCIVVSATLGFSPILPDATYSWATSLTLSSTVTIRTQ